MGKVLLLEFTNVRGSDLVEVSLDTSVKNAHLLLSRHGDVLLLLQQLSELLSSIQKLLGGSIEIRSELGESSNLSVLSELELHGTGDLFHCLDLGSGSDSGHRKTDVNGGSNTFVEKLSLEEDLSISDGNNVGGDISRHITSLGLNDGKGSEGSGSVCLVHLSSSLEESGVKIEDISGVSLSTRRSSEEERHLSVGNGLLGQVVVDNESVLVVVSEELSNSTSGVGGQELKRSGVGGSGGDNDGVFHGIEVSKGLDNVGDGGSLLTDGNVNAVKLLGIIVLSVSRTLVNDSIDSNGGLSSLPVSNDELSLASSNGHEGVDSLKSGLHGLVHRLSRDDTGSLELNSLSHVGVDGSESVDGGSEGVDDSSEHAITDGDIDNGSGSLNDIAFLDLSIVTKDDNSYVISLKVEGHTLDS